MCFNKSCTLARASPTNGEIHAIRLSPRAFLPARSPALGRQSKSGVPASKLTRGGMGRRTKSGLPVPKLAHGHGWIEDSLRKRVVDLLRENEKKRRVKESAGSSGVSRTPCRSRVCHHWRGAKRNCRWCAAETVVSGDGLRLPCSSTRAARRDCPCPPSRRSDQGASETPPDTSCRTTPAAPDAGVAPVWQ